MAFYPCSDNTCQNDWLAGVRVELSSVGAVTLDAVVKMTGQLGVRVELQKIKKGLDRIGWKYTDCRW